jgi:hypothetical protein
MIKDEEPDLDETEISEIFEKSSSKQSTLISAELQAKIMAEHQASMKTLIEA